MTKQELLQALDKADIDYVDLNYQLSIGQVKTWVNKSGKPTIKHKNKQQAFNNMEDYVKALQSIENTVQ